ncbi:MAG: hypothetical protein RL154_467 [Pseudomonadota bacterium]
MPTSPNHTVKDIEDFLLDNNDFIIIGNGFESKRIASKLDKIHKTYGLFDCDSYDNYKELLKKEAKNNKKIIVASLNDFNSKNWELYIKDVLLGFGYKPYADFVCLMGYFCGMEHFERYNSLFGKQFYNFYTNNKEKFDNARQILNDDYSRQIFDKVINYKMYSTEPDKLGVDLLPSSIERLNDFEQKAEETKLKLNYTIDNGLQNSITRNMAIKPYSYFDIVSPENSECVIDAGGFNGDTAIMFELMGAKSVHSFEPIESLFDKIQTVSKLSNVIDVHALGLWNKTTTLRFTTLKRDTYIGMGSFISEQGEDKIDVVSLDEFVKEKQLDSVDFIKMDIEGAEIEAMQGAYNTIKQYKPDLAICIYHVDSHLYEIPLWIKTNFPDYDIYIDHKFIHPAETVCYAKAKK